MLEKIRKILRSEYRQSINIRSLQISHEGSRIVHITIEQVHKNIVVVNDRNQNIMANALTNSQLEDIYNGI
jgi:hypothetical protein